MSSMRLIKNSGFRTVGGNIVKITPAITLLHTGQSFMGSKKVAGIE